MEARRRAVGGETPMLVPRRLLVISCVTHYAYDGHLHAFGLYALEIDRWAQLFERITIAAPLRAAVPTKDAFRFKAQNIDVAPQREVGGVTWRVRAGGSARSLADPQRTG
jgi:hypothetical protein